MFQKYLRHLRLLALLAAAPLAAHAQTGAVGIGTATPDASAALEVSSTSKGLLPPRLSQTQRDAIASPAAGLTIYNTSTGVLNTWDGSKWAATLTYSTASVTPNGAFAYTGGAQTYTVPAGVTALTVDLAGAAGGPVNNGTTGQGLGGRVQAVLAVVPGQVLTIQVGGAGGRNVGGYNGGGGTRTGFNYNSGGGGASDIRLGGAALTNRVLVAGGGGGGGGYSVGGVGGAGGGLTGGNGGSNLGSSSILGGFGGSQSAPGAGGDGFGSGGGSGATGGTEDGGGGGGGYFGGGAGDNDAGGGGGSSYAGAGTSSVAHTQGFQNGNGYVNISAGVAPLPAPYLDGSNISNVAGVIKSQTTQQVGANFNIGGNGAVGGNLGIGTSSALTRLSISPGTVEAKITLYDGGSSANHYGFGISNAQLNYHVDGSGSSHVFWAGGKNGNGTELLRIQGNGNVGIGISPAAAYKLDVAGSVNATGQVRANGVVLTSDQRFKQNIRPLRSALASALALRGVRYEWNALGVQHGGKAGAPQVGFIAQELEKVYPELVSTDADGYKAVNYAQLTPVLLEALKEQQQQIEALKARAATAEAAASSAKAQATQATATLETFEARLRRLEAAGGQAQR